MLNTKRFKNRPTEQGELLPTYTSDLIDEDHPARVMSAIVDTLDLSPLYSKYSWEGGETYHPKSMLKVLFYGYSHGTRSSRKISQACRENKDIFKQVVKLCYQLEMISFGTISLDGTKIRANASTHRIVKKDKLEQLMDKLIYPGRSEVHGFLQFSHSIKSLRINSLPLFGVKA